MKQQLAALTLYLLMSTVGLRVAAAQPVTGSGAEVAWLTPEHGALLDLRAGTEKSVGMAWPRRLPSQPEQLLAARLSGGEVAWVHIDGPEPARRVRFLLVSGDVADAAAVSDAVPSERQPGDFVFVAPPGPATWLAIGARPGEAPPSVQVWVASTDSPGFRWELWEQQAKAWAKRGQDASPPEPPDLVAQPEMTALALVHDAVELAQAESPPSPPSGITPLLRAEALLADLPAREPLFPYFRRADLTAGLAHGRVTAKVAAQQMLALSPDEPLQFTVDGPALLRIEARGRFAPGAPLRAVPLDVELRAGRRLLALNRDEASPIETSPAGMVSSPRRLLLAAAPGRHTYEVQVHGSPAWISVILHRRAIHAEQLTSRSEDIPRMLRKVHASAGALADLLAGETSYLNLDDETARAHFLALQQSARSPRLRAFAELRLAALADGVTPAQAAQTMQGTLALLADAKDEAAERLRQAIIARYLLGVLARSAHYATPSRADVALLLTHPGALMQMLETAGPLLRYAPGQRALALPLLADALARRPLDAGVLHQLTHEWFTGTRWGNLIGTELGAARRSDLLAPQRESSSCAHLVAQGVRAYGPLPSDEGVLTVDESLAPRQSLRRFHLIALRRGKPALGWADLVLDGQRARLPLVLPTELIPIALAAGRHTLRATLGEEKDATMLAPCWLLAHAGDVDTHAESPLLIEHHYTELTGKSGMLRVAIPEPGTAAFLGLEVRASPELAGGRLMLRTDQGEIGTVTIYGRGRDANVISRLPVGPAVTVVLPVPAATRVLEITRKDEGAPLLVRALIRRSLAPQPGAAPRWPARERDPALLAALRQATRALRQASGATAQAEWRLHRAEILTALGALGLARLDVEEALPNFSDEQTLQRARALLVALGELPLLPPPPASAPARSALVLAAGANLSAAGGAASACAADAVARFASDPAEARRAAAACSDLVGRYIAARLEEQGGSGERAAQHYTAAFRQSVAEGNPRPALAREGALRFAELGPGPNGSLALALALTAAQDDDPDGPRAVERVRGLSFAGPVRALDSGTEVRRPEHAEPLPSLRAALADEPWEPGLFLEAHPGQSAETEFMLNQPIQVRLETLCDVRGGLPGVGPPCELGVEADGRAIADLDARLVPAGQKSVIATLSLDKGAHRIRVSLLPTSGAGVAFVHLITSRPLNGAVAAADGSAAMPVVAPPMRRFLATQAQPVQLRAHGPTALRIDALVDPESGASARGLAVALSLDGKPTSERTYPLCTPAGEQLPRIDSERYDCRAGLRVPLLQNGTYEITLRPVGTQRLALALAAYEQPPLVPQDNKAADVDSVLPQRALARAASPALQALPKPPSNLLRELGTLEVQQLFSYTNTGPTNPQSGVQDSPQNTPQNERLPGDAYTETSILYHRKLDDLPIWMQGAAYLRGRRGSPSYGFRGLVFGRVPLLQLRIYADVSAFTQSILGNQEAAVALHSYLERSFPIFPHFFILPRFSFNARYQSLDGVPTPTGDARLTPIDSQVFNPYNATHPRGIYGQLLLWWVPFINMITYAQVRVTSNQSVRQLDAVNGRTGFDLAIRTTELTGYYSVTKLFVDDARANDLLLHELAGELHQSIWVHRNHRIGLWLYGNVEVRSGDATMQAGLYWEGSPGRGTDDYSTPVINLPQQLGQGRGVPRTEETLR